MQCAYTILPPVACLAVQYFSTFSQKGKIFEKKVIEYKISVLIFSKNLPDAFLVIRRIKRDMLKSVLVFV